MRLRIVDSPRSARLRGVLVVTALALLTAVGCSSSTKPKTDAGSSTYTGAVAGTTISGTLVVTIATATPAAATAATGIFGNQNFFNATATFTQTKPVAATVTLSGDYSDDFHAFGVTGTGPGGAVWLFTGDLKPYGFAALGDPDTVSDPEELYAGLMKGTTDVIKVIGTYTTTTPPGGPAGNFNLTISGTEVHGYAVASDGKAVPLDGTYNPANGAIAIFTATTQFAPGPTPAVGTLSGTTANGTFSNSLGEGGTWTGTKQ